MRLAIAILVTLIAAPGALAQSLDGLNGPLTGYEAGLMSDVWSEIRQAERFEDIDWHAHDLNRAPASPEAQRFFAIHWDKLRREERFADIEWEKYRDERHDGSPFTREESAAMSRAWGRIRLTGRFDDIDWRAIGFRGAPGDREARRIMSQNWGRLRQAERFEDIDWQATTGYVAR